MTLAEAFEDGGRVLLADELARFATAAGLSPAEWTALELRVCREATWQEIAAVLQVSPPTARARAAAALELVAAQLEQEAQQSERAQEYQWMADLLRAMKPEQSAPPTPVFDECGARVGLHPALVTPHEALASRRRLAPEAAAERWRQLDTLAGVLMERKGVSRLEALREALGLAEHLEANDE